jgi:hypothetical protein
MTSRAEAKVLTVGQIAIGERTCRPRNAWLLPCQEPLWHLVCLSWKPFSSRRQRRAVLSAWPGTCTTNGVEPNRHISTCNVDRFARQKWDLGARAALPPHRQPPIDENFHGHPKSSPHSGGIPRSVGRRDRRRYVRGLCNGRYTGSTGERRVGGSHASEGQCGVEG